MDGYWLSNVAPWIKGLSGGLVMFVICEKIIKEKPFLSKVKIDVE